jgi:hypothetical protein
LHFVVVEDRRREIAGENRHIMEVWKPSEARFRSIVLQGNFLPENSPSDVHKSLGIFKDYSGTLDDIESARE